MMQLYLATFVLWTFCAS